MGKGHQGGRPARELTWVLVALPHAIFRSKMSTYWT